MTKRTLKLVTIAIGFAVSLYIFPREGAQPVRGVWGPALDWGRFHIVQTGEMASPIISENYIEGLKDYGVSDPLPKILLGIVNIVLGVVEFPNDVHLLSSLPLIGSLLLPILGLAWYRRVSGNIYDKEAVIDGALVVLVALFPLASVLSQLSGGLNPSVYARGLFFVILYTLSRAYINNAWRRWGLLAAGLSAIMFNYYHTWTFYLIIYIAVMLAALILTREQYHGSRVVLIALLVFPIVGLWVNSQIIVEPVFFLVTSEFLTDPSAILFQETPSPYSELLSKNDKEGLYPSVILTHTVLLSAIVAMFGVIVAQKHLAKSHDRSGDIWMIFSIGHGFVGIAFLIYSGIEGILGRFFEVLPTFIVFLSGYLLMQESRTLKNTVRVIAVAMILLGLVGYLVAPPATGALSHQEIEGLEYTATHTSDEPVFADFRLSTPMLYYGKTNLYSIHSKRDDPQQVKALLTASYYADTSACRELDSYLGLENYFVVLSNTQSSQVIEDPVRQFKPADENFQNDWDSDDSYHKVFSNGEIQLHQRTRTPC